MPDLPRGTVTFLFTDIEGSTALWERNRTAMEAAVARHIALLDAAIQAHGGTHFKTTGDAVQAAFPTAPQAVAAATVGQRTLLAEDWREVGTLPVRIALHAGEAEPDARGDYLAAPLNRLARLLAAGHGGQILLSQTVQQLTRGALPDRVELRDLGEHRLRDLLEPERVFQVIHPELPVDFPTLRTLASRPNNLPRQPTSLIGRERDLGVLGDLLRREDVHLVTLTGPGGTGKTRLALQAAADLLDHFEDGVFWVDLAPLADPSLMLPTIARTLGVREIPTVSLREAVVANLAEKHFLLVLDNYEHLLATAPITADLLAAAPNLRVLATSRAPLRLQAEREYPVPPLLLPTKGQKLSVAQLSDVAAIALFAQRAQAVKPDFVLTAENAEVVTEICRRLDGLPLAIELAAARVKVLPPAALLARLQHRLPLLTGGARDLPARHRTLRDTIAWSDDLLSANERRLFHTLAVFAGGAPLAAVEAVVNPDDSLDVLEGVAALIEHSLLRQVEGVACEPRVAMFETIHEYALERLDASGEAGETRHRHAAWFVQRAEHLSHPKRRSKMGTPQDVAELETDYANLSAALTWLTQVGDAAMALRLAAALGGFWNLRGHLGDGRRWLEQTLAQDDGTQPQARVKALLWLGMLVGSRGDPVRGKALLDEAEALARASGDMLGIATTLVDRGFAVLDGRGDAELARTLGEESLVMFEAADIPWGITASRTLLARVAEQRGDLVRAEQLNTQLLADDQQNGGDPYLAAHTLHSLGTLARLRGDDTRAATFYAEALVRFNDLGDLGSVAWCLEGVASTSDRSRAEQAARLFAAAEALRAAIAMPLPLAERPEYDRTVAGVRASMGEPAFTAAWLAGAALPVDAAIVEAGNLAAF